MPDHPLSTMKKLDPEFMKHLEEIDALVYADGALPRKIKLSFPPKTGQGV
jgi:hypothetical protein